MHLLMQELRYIMTDQLIDVEYTDSYGRKILWDNSVRNVHSYRSTGESWDRGGNNTASWYIENTLPNDSFYGTDIDDDRWTYFNTRGTISGSVNNRLSLNIVKQEARGGITSEGKWELVGDFDVRLYVDESSYYNEYRSETSTGLTISISDNYKYRISKYFDGSTIGYKAHNLRGDSVHFLGWFEGGEINTSVGEEYTTCLRVVREGDSILSYVSKPSGEFAVVGSGVSSEEWLGNASVEIEVQTQQYNTYGMDVVGITVSGSLSEENEFFSYTRGESCEFPENSVLLVDDLGMSIVDEDSMSLWMRFVNSSNYMFKASDTELSAVEGKVYYTTSSGLVCLDFVNDSSVWYLDGLKRQTNAGISGRNYSITSYDAGTSTLVANNDVLSVCSKSVLGNTFVAVGTSGGIGVLINSSEEKVGPEGNIEKVYISDDGNLYWSDYDVSTGTGKLYYKEGISNLVGAPDTFLESGYYSSDSSPISISSENINDIYAKDTLDGNVIVIGHSVGIDYIRMGERITYGPVNISNPFSDPYFSEYLGISWRIYVPEMFPVFDVSTTDIWKTVGSRSLRAALKSSGYVQSGYFSGVYQQVDLSNSDKIYFDYNLVSTSSTNLIDLEIAVDGTVLLTVSDTLGSHVKYNNVVDVSNFTGVSTFEIRVKSKYSGLCDSSNVFMVDNVRSVQSIPDYSIIPSSAHSVLEVLLLYELSEKKIFFSTSEGYGAIDIPSNSLDFFTEVSSYLPLSSILSAEYVEYIDEV